MNRAFRNVKAWASMLGGLLLGCQASGGDSGVGTAAGGSTATGSPSAGGAGGTVATGGSSGSAQGGSASGASGSAGTSGAGSAGAAGQCSLEQVIQSKPKAQCPTGAGGAQVAYDVSLLPSGTCATEAPCFLPVWKPCCGDPHGAVNAWGCLCAAGTWCCQVTAASLTACADAACDAGGP